MLKLNRMTDYGVVVLAHLAEADGQVLTTPEIAAATRLSQPTVAKLLKLLAQGGLAVSHRGARGGYTLARRPAEISMFEAVEVLDGPVAVTSCVETDHEGCNREPVCPMSGRWDPVNVAIRTTLERITLADMIAPDSLFHLRKAAPAPPTQKAALTA